MRYGRVVRGTVLGAVALWSSAIGSQAIAQQAPAAGVREQEVDLIAAVIYDTNVARSNAALAAARGIDPQDEIFQPSVSFNLARPVGRETGYLQGSAGYSFYVRNRFLNREVLDIRPGVLGRLGPCQGNLSGSYSRAQSDLRDLALLPPGSPTRNLKNVIEAEQIAFTTDCGRQIGFAPTATVSQSWSDNSSALIGATNSRSFSASAGLAYRRPSLGDITLFGQYSKTEFPQRRFLVGGHPVTDGYANYAGGVTYTRAVGSKLQGKASFSYTSLNQVLPGATGFQGFTYSVNASYRATSRLQAQVSFDRATMPSNRFGSNFSVNESYLANVDYRLNRRWTIRLGGSRVHSRYNGSALFDLTDQTLDSIYGVATLALTRRFSLDLNVTGEQRDANFPGLSYSGARVGLTARATF